MRILIVIMSFGDIKYSIGKTIKKGLSPQRIYFSQQIVYNIPRNYSVHS